MNVHEYQAKELLKSYGTPVLRGQLATTPKGVQAAYATLGAPVAVVKAQVHAGGRGKAGGVKLVRSAEDAINAGRSILGMTLVSPQTGPRGKLVNKVWVEEGASIVREIYLGMLVDRDNAGLAIIVSNEGGMEIEEVAHNTPEKVLNVRVSWQTGLQDFHIRRMTQFLGIGRDKASSFAHVVRSLYKAFIDLDASLIEINPLIETAEGTFICLDAKMSIDDNALFRQPRVKAMMDYDEIDEKELEAFDVGINYIALDGNIACMVNGAGLAMATMDIIQQAGGRPANFLDVGGGATREMVTSAFKIILKDPSVKAILVNIFGGIMRCDVIAEGIIEAAKALGLKVPVVVRLEGTNVELGKKLLAESGLRLIAADDMMDAAKKVVAAQAS